MFLVSILSVLLTLGHGVHSHLCVWSPMQRDAFDISTPGARACYRKPGPCGNINATSASPRTSLVAGSTFNIEFQQNLNHYYTVKPGALDVSFANGLNPAESDFRVLHSFPDYNAMNQITQTNFSIAVQLPSEACDQCVVRVRYLTNNPEEDDHGTTFHQCSDIKLTSSLARQEKPVARPIENAHAGQADPHDCCAPDSYMNIFSHTIPAIDFRSEGLIFYDKVAKQMRVTVANNGGRGNSTDDGIFDMWMNFTSGYQYYYNRNTGQCDLYGLDYWNDWCFGNKYNQSEDFVAADVPCAVPGQPGDKCHQWRNGEFLFEVFASGDCLPHGISRPSGEQMNYLRGTSGPIAPGAFVPNPVCLKQTKVKHASPHWMRRHF